MTRLDRRVFAIVPAAGSSSRMGATCSKALLPLGKKAVIEHTLTGLNSVLPISHVVILAPQRDISAFSRLAIPSRLESAVIAGGGSRSESVRIGLDYLKATWFARDEDIVLVHDAARCFASGSLIQRCVDAAVTHGAITAAVPIVDTVQRVNGENRVIESVDRTNLWAVQTPQAFLFHLLWRAHQSPHPDATDDTSLVREFHPITIVPGERKNIKLTTPEDYELAKSFLDSPLFFDPPANESSVAP